MEALTNSRLINKENYVNEIDKIFTRIDEIQEKLENVDEEDDEHVNQVKLDLYPEQIELLEDKAEKLQDRFMKDEERYETLMTEVGKMETTEYNLEYLKSAPNPSHELGSIVRAITQVLVNLNESKE
jgi:predicted  nucleic acid-binding Zn-ribbon protein|tara:strand:- start:1681 stop:2061 length:381 start_codon:yes stop_codon:yes gene_type:complete